MCEIAWSASWSFQRRRFRLRVAHSFPLSLDNNALGQRKPGLLSFHTEHGRSSTCVQYARAIELGPRSAQWSRTTLGHARKKPSTNAARVFFDTSDSDRFHFRLLKTHRVLPSLREASCFVFSTDVLFRVFCIS